MGARSGGLVVAAAVAASAAAAGLSGHSGSIGSLHALRQAGAARIPASTCACMCMYRCMYMHVQARHLPRTGQRPPPANL